MDASTPDMEKNSVQDHIEISEGDYVGQDKHIHGDEVHGDKILGDKVLGDKISISQIPTFIILTVGLVAAVLFFVAVGYGYSWLRGEYSNRDGNTIVSSTANASLAPMSGDFNIAIAPFHSLDSSPVDSQNEALVNELISITSDAISETVARLADDGITVEVRRLEAALAEDDPLDLVRVAEEMAVQHRANIILFGIVEMEGDGRATRLEPRFYISKKRIPHAESLAGVHPFGPSIIVTGSLENNVTARREIRQQLSERMKILSDFVVAVGEYAAGHYEQADETLKEVEALVSDQPDIWDDDSRVMLYFFLGVVAGERLDYESSKQYYQQVLNLDPDYARARLGLAQLKFFESGMIPDRNCAPGMVDDSGLLQSITMHEDVLTQYDYSPDDDTPTRTRFLLAQVFVCIAASRTDVESAREYWQKALNAYQQVIDDYNEYDQDGRFRLGDLAARAYGGLGLVHGFSNIPDIQNVELAIQEYERAIELSLEPDQVARFYAQLVDIFVTKNDCALAKEHWSAADGAYQEYLNTNPGYDDDRLLRRLQHVKARIAEECHLT